MGLPVPISVHHVYEVPSKAGREPGYPRTRVIDDCEPLCGWWDSNPGLPEEQPVLLTSESSLRLVHFPVPIVLLTSSYFHLTEQEVVTYLRQYYDFCHLIGMFFWDASNYWWLNLSLLFPFCFFTLFCVPFFLLFLLSWASFITIQVPHHIVAFLVLVLLNWWLDLGSQAHARQGIGY